MAFVRELIAYLRTRKKYWLLPIFLALGIVAGLVAFQGSALGPFIYALF